MWVNNETGVIQDIPTLTGLALHEGLDLASLKLLIVALFIFLTSPTATHAIARAAKRNDVGWWVQEDDA